MTSQKISQFTIVLIMFFGVMISYNTASANELAQGLINSMDQCVNIELELADLVYERRDALREFVSLNTNEAFYKKNLKYLDSVSGNSDVDKKLSSLLKSEVSSIRERKQLLQSLVMPDIPQANLKALSDSLKVLLYKLRIPDPETGGYIYADYIRSPGGTADSQKLVAQHEIGNWQEYHKTFNVPIYRIKFYSPRTNSLFKGNRDVYLENMRIDYKSSGSIATVNHSFDRFLKRGESIDFELPEIVNEATINVRFACKPEHRGDAVFVIEPILAQMKDSPDSPFWQLISTIKSFDFKNKSISDLQVMLKRLRQQLGDAIVIIFQGGSL